MVEGKFTHRETRTFSTRRFGVRYINNLLQNNFDIIKCFNFPFSRPGILCLVNDADWELLGELDYEIQPKDNILFISTLHGG